MQKEKFYYGLFTWSRVRNSEEEDEDTRDNNPLQESYEEKSL